MKKAYINPCVRVVEVECSSLIALSALGGDATTNEVLSRRHRQDEWEEEEEDLIDMLLMQQNKK